MQGSQDRVGLNDSYIFFVSAAIVAQPNFFRVRRVQPNFFCNLSSAINRFVQSDRAKTGRDPPVRKGSPAFPPTAPGNRFHLPRQPDNLLYSTDGRGDDGRLAGHCLEVDDSERLVNRLFGQWKIAVLTPNPRTVKFGRSNP